MKIMSTTNAPRRVAKTSYTTVKIFFINLWSFFAVLIKRNQVNFEYCAVNI